MVVSLEPVIRFTAVWMEGIDQDGATSLSHHDVCVSLFQARDDMQLPQRAVQPSYVTLSTFSQRCLLQSLIGLVALLKYYIIITLSFFSHCH